MLGFEFLHGGVERVRTRRTHSEIVLHLNRERCLPHCETLVIASNKACQS